MFYYVKQHHPFKKFTKGIKPALDNLFCLFFQIHISACSFNDNFKKPIFNKIVSFIIKGKGISKIYWLLCTYDLEAEIGDYPLLIICFL